MSHNPALVLITNVVEQDDELLLSKLNLGSYIRAENQSYGQNGSAATLCDVTYDFFTDRLFIGRYGQVLILVNGPITWEFLRTDLSATEEAFIKAFPSSDIVSLSYASTSTSYSYVVIRNGEKIRVKHGSQDGPLIDHGEPLPLELEIGIDDLLSPGDLEDLRSDRSALELEFTLDGLRGSAVMHRLVSHYLGGLELHTQGLEAIKVTEFVKLFAKSGI
ncbi:MAG: hypothetical protein QM762_13565 [Chryseolinea sp.]